MDKLTNVAVDVGTRAVAGQHAPGHDRLAFDRLRVIAFVGHGHQAVLQPKRADDLGGTGQQGGNPHLSRQARTG